MASLLQVQRKVRVAAEVQRSAKETTVDARSFEPHPCSVKGEFTAIIGEAPEGGYWAFCPEEPGANGQGETVEEAKGSLGEAIQTPHGQMPLTGAFVKRPRARLP